MNQLHDAEAGNIVPEQGEIGAIGGEPLPPPPPVVVLLIICMLCYFITHACIN